MKKELFDKYVDLANGNPVVVFGDNVMLFNINMEGNHFVQTDDCIICFKTNKLASGWGGVSQADAPWEVVIFDYDQIQYLRIYPDPKTLVKFFEGTVPVVEGETVEDIQKAILSSKIMQASGPVSPNGTGLPIPYSGAVVTMDKEPDKYILKQIDDWNKEHNQ